MSTLDNRDSLTRKIKKISAVLLDKPSTLHDFDTVLQQKLDALELLVECLKGGLCTLPTAARYMKLLRTPLSLQLEASPLPLVTQSCEVISLLLQSETDLGYTVVDWFVPQLLKLTLHSSTIISRQALEALLTVARECFLSSDSMSEILRKCLSVNKNCRWNSYTTLLTVLLNYPGTSSQGFLSEFSSPMSKVIAKGLSDVSVDVRRVAKKCLSIFLTIEPELSENIIRSLDPQQIKALSRDEDSNALPDSTNTAEGETRPVAARYLNPTTTTADTRSSVFSDRERLGVKSFNLARLNDDLRKTKASLARASKVEPPNHHHHRSMTVKGRVLEVQDDVVHTSSNKTKQTALAQNAEELMFFLPLLSSSEWESRLIALKNVIHVLSTSSLGSAEVLTLLPEVLPRLTDSHFQIVRAALRCTRLFMEKFLEYLSSFLSDVVLYLLMDTTHTKPDVQVTSAQLIKYLLDHVDAADMEASLHLSVGSGRTPAVRQRALEVLQFVYQAQPAIFSSRVVMSRNIRFLLLQMTAEGTRRSSLWKTLLSTLVSLYAMDQRSFLMVLSLLTSGEQSQVRNYLSEAIPQLNHDLNALVKGKHTEWNNPLHITLAETEFSRLLSSRFSSTEGNLIPEKPSPTARKFRSHSPIEEESDRKREASPTSFSTFLLNSKRPSLFTSALSPSSFPNAQDAPYEDDLEEDVVGRGETLDPVTILEQVKVLPTSTDRWSGLQQLRRSLSARAKQWDLEKGIRLLSLLDRYALEMWEGNHRVRQAAFATLQTFLKRKELQHCVKSRLFKLIQLCVLGMDDSFLEVRQEAALTFHLLTTPSHSIVSLDVLLQTLTSILRRWLSGPEEEANDSTPGRLEVILAVGRTLEFIHSATTDAREVVVSIKHHTLDSLLDVLSVCLTHCSPVVSQQAALTLAAARFTFGESIVPLLSGLSSAQKRMVEHCYKKYYPMSEPFGWVVD